MAVIQTIILFYAVLMLENARPAAAEQRYLRQFSNQTFLGADKSFATPPAQVPSSNGSVLALDVDHFEATVKVPSFLVVFTMERGTHQGFPPKGAYYYSFSGLSPPLFS